MRQKQSPVVMPQHPTANQPHRTELLVDLTEHLADLTVRLVDRTDTNQLVNHTVFNQLEIIQATTTNKNHLIFPNADLHRRRIHAQHTDHNTIHCQETRIATSNVHSNVYLSNHVRLTLSGILALLVAIGQQLPRTVVIRTEVVHRMAVDRHTAVAHPMVLAVLLLLRIHHRIRTVVNDAQWNARNVNWFQFHQFH